MKQRDAIDETLARLGRGIVLAPFGGVVALVAVVMAAYPRLHDDLAVAGLLSSTIILGTFLAAPVTCIVLPLARGPRRWAGKSMMAGLAIAGAASCVVELIVGFGWSVLEQEARMLHVGVLRVLWRELSEPRASSDAGLLLLVLVPAEVASGAACGFLFALWTRPSEAQPG